LGVKLVVKSKMDIQALLRILQFLRRVEHTSPLNSLLIRGDGRHLIIEALFKPLNSGVSRIHVFSRKISMLPGVFEVKVLGEDKNG